MNSTAARVWPWLWRVLLDWTIIAACFFLVRHFPSVFVIAGCLLVIGARQHAVAIMGHDGAHRLVSRNHWINDTLTGMLCLWPLGVALEGYRRFHFGHHRNVGTASDPEYLHKHHPRLGQWTMPLKPSRVGFQILLDFVGGALPHLGMAAMLTKPISFKDALGPAVMATVFIGMSGAFGCLWIPALWYGSIGTSFFVAFRIRLWTEHVGAEHTHRISATTVQRFFLLPHNTWCHWEHHRDSSIPCWALPATRSAREATLTLSALIRKLSPPAPKHLPRDVRQYSASR